MIAALLLAVAAAASPAPSGVCTALSAEIDAAQMRTSDNAVSELGDNSAARQNARNADNTAQMAEVQANIALMSAHHCPAYAHAVSLNSYLGAALHCNVVAEKDSSTPGHMIGVRGPEAKAACDRATWTRDGG